MTEKVAVVGAGTIGVQTLLSLASKGARVTAYESFQSGHTRGSAGGDTRLFTLLDVADEDYSEVIAHSQTCWHKLNEATGKPLLQQTGALVIDSFANPNHLNLNRADIQTLQRLTLDEASSQYPQLRFFQDDAIFFDPNAGFIRPELSNFCVSVLAKEQGAVIEEGISVVKITNKPTGVELTLDNGETKHFDRVVVSAGAWTPKLLPEVKNYIAVRRLTSSWFFPQHPETFQTLTPIMRLAPDYFYGIPSPDKQGIKLGVGFEHHLPVENPDTVARWVEKDELQHIASISERFLPGVKPSPYRSDTYFETYTKNRRELLDWLDPDQRIFVATGFSGHGFKVAPAIGEYIAAQFLGEQPPFNYNKFSRFSDESIYDH